MASALELVERQLEAYNAKDLEGFVSLFSPEVKVFNFPNELVLTGREAFRRRYEERFKTPGLYAAIEARRIMGKYILDFEHVTQDGQENGTKVIAIYEVSDKAIENVWFIRG